MTAGKSLSGKKILVTRPAHQSAQLSELLRAEGAEPIEIPLIRICPPDSWSEFDKAFKMLDKYKWLLFASANAVETCISRAREIGVFEHISALQIACLGASTAETLGENGLVPAIIPDEYIAESLISKFPAASSTEWNKILWARTNLGRNNLKTGLEEKGWSVDIVHSYQTKGPENPAATAEQIRSLLDAKQLYAITLASSETCNQLNEILTIATKNKDRQDPVALLGGVKLAAIGPETGRTCIKLFGRVDVQASEHTSAGLLEAIKRG